MQERGYIHMTYTENKNALPVDVSDDPDLLTLENIIQNIELLTDDYLQKIGADRVQDIKPLQYNGLLMHIYLNYFKPTKILYKHIQGVYNDKCITCMYNDHLLFLLCYYYIYMCSLYGFVSNPAGFSMFTGVDLDTLKRWENLESQRPDAYGLIKKLRKAYETALEIGAQSGKNAVGYIATLNHRFAWSTENKQTLTVNITRSQDQILQSFDHELLTENAGNVDK